MVITIQGDCKMPPCLPQNKALRTGLTAWDDPLVGSGWIRLALHRAAPWPGVDVPAPAVSRACAAGEVPENTGWISKSTYDMLRKFEALDVELLESLEVTLQRRLWQQTWRYGIAKNIGTLGDVLYLESRTNG